MSGACVWLCADACRKSVCPCRVTCWGTEDQCSYTESMLDSFSHKPAKCVDMQTKKSADAPTCRHADARNKQVDATSEAAPAAMRTATMAATPSATTAMIATVAFPSAMLLSMFKVNCALTLSKPQPLAEHKRRRAEAAAGAGPHRSTTSLGTEICAAGHGDKQFRSEVKTAKSRRCHSTAVRLPRCAMAHSCPDCCRESGRLVAAGPTLSRTALCPTQPRSEEQAVGTLHVDSATTGGACTEAAAEGTSPHLTSPLPQIFVASVL